MNFIEQNQRIVKKIYKEIENLMVESYEKGHKKSRIFEYTSYIKKAFCMPEVDTKSNLSTFNKLYNCSLVVLPVAKVGTKLVLVGYCPSNAEHKNRLKKIQKTYEKYPIEKIREKKEPDGK